jgi:predicted TIM-barrel fold metal-dependent hydrolase
MQHGADPWWDIAIRLMIKYRNLYLMTSAYSPKYLPESLLHYMNTRGKNKIMFASDHPVLSMDRCLEEAQTLDLRPGILEKYLYENADAVLFGERSPRHGAFK